MAVGNERQRVTAAHSLVAGLEADLLVLLAARQVHVVVPAVDGRVDTPHVVDGLLELAEVDLDHVVDRYAGELLHRLDQRRDAAARQREVQTSVRRPVRALNRDLELAGDRHHRDVRLARVEANEQHLVGVREDRRRRGALALVVAHQQDVLRTPEASGSEPAPDLQCGVEVQRALEGAYLPRPEHGARHRGAEQDNQAAEEHPPEEPPSRRLRRRLGRRGPRRGHACGRSWRRGRWGRGDAHGDRPVRGLVAESLQSAAQR